MPVVSYLWLAFLLSLVLFLFRESQIGEFLLQMWSLRLVAFGLGVLTCATGMVLGWGLRSRVFPGLQGRMALSLSFLMGMWLLSIVTFALGSAGVMFQFSAAILALTINVVGWRAWRDMGHIIWQQVNALQRFSLLESWWFALIALLWGGYLMLCFTPAFHFDDLAYHLGAPWTYVKQGQMTYLPYNVYASFPEHIEMLGYFVFSLFDDAFHGGMIAKMLITSYTLVMVVMAYDIAREYVERDTALFASLLVLSLPWTAALTLRFHVEIPLTAALMAAMWLIITPDPLDMGSTRRAVLIGLFVGIAASVKYNGIFFGLPIVFVLYALYSAPRYWVKHCVIIAVVAAVVVSPWLIRNAVYTGNPVYPLLNALFESPHLNPADTARWDQAHEPGAYGYFEFLSSLKKLVLGQDRNSVMALFLFPGFLWAMLKGHALVKLCAPLALWLLLWFGFTHRIERFMYPAMAIVMIAMAVGWEVYKENFQRIALSLTAVFFLTINFLHLGKEVGPDVAYVFNQETEGDYLEKRLPAWPAYEFINERYNDKKINGTMLMVGDPKDFYLPRHLPTITHSVFDSRLIMQLAHHPVGLEQALANLGVNYVFMNNQEIRRYHRTYSYYYQGNEHPGFVPAPTLTALQRFLAKRAIRIYPENTESMLTGNPHEVYYIPPAKSPQAH